MTMSNLRSAQQTGEIPPVMGTKVNGLTTPNLPAEGHETDVSDCVDIRKKTASLYSSQFPALSPGSTTSNMIGPTQVVDLNSIPRTTTTTNGPSSQKTEEALPMTQEQSKFEEHWKQYQQSRISISPTSSSSSQPSKRSVSRKQFAKGEGHDLCFNCNKPGHQAAACKLEKIRRCSICKSETHLKRQCPQAKEGNKSKSSKNNLVREQQKIEASQQKGDVDGLAEQARFEKENEAETPKEAEPIPVIPTPKKPTHESEFREEFNQNYDSLGKAVQMCLDDIEVKIDSDKLSVLKEEWVHKPILFALYAIMFAIGLLLTMILSSLSFVELLSSPYSIFVGLSVLSANGMFRPIWTFLKNQYRFKLAYQSFLVNLYERSEGRFYSFTVCKYAESTFTTCGLDMRHITNSLTGLKYKMYPMTLLMNPVLPVSQNKLTSFFSWWSTIHRVKKDKIIQKSSTEFVKASNKKCTNYVICAELLSQLLTVKNANKNDTTTEIEHRMRYAAQAMHGINIDKYFSLAYGNVYTNTIYVATHIQRTKNLIETSRFADFAGPPLKF